jgi:nitroimidazol reductase NimA-like FMN-containing flavoprotein (pyridoxamine 5'-phosphate oxidase superfamily)
MHEEIARQILDANSYMTLATADESGTPWASPVWFAPSEYRELFWISSPDARHSRNIAVRPQVSIVVFDSRVRPGEGQAVYMAAVAQEVDGDELERGVAVFTQREAAQGLSPLTIDQVTDRARHRLYRATVSEHWILDPAGRDGRPGEVRDERVSVNP